MIRELDLSKNHLKTLPKNFGALAGLKMLDLLGNNLTDLPSSFSELKNLQVIRIQHENTSIYSCKLTSFFFSKVA